MEQLRNFSPEAPSEVVSFVETIQVTTGVECDVYTFTNDASKDLGVIRIAPGCKTPLQRVIQPNTITIEGYLQGNGSGKGTLVIGKLDGSFRAYEVNENMEEPLSVTVEVGETMQWQADQNSGLIAYEICFPPYQDGRYEDLPE